MLEIKKVTKETVAQVLEDMRSRAANANEKIDKIVASVLADVQVRGYEAVKEYSLRFDGTEPYEITKEQLEKAAEECPRDLYRAMEQAAKNIWDYQSRLLPKSSSWTIGTGSVLGQVVRGLTRVGIYVPGGSAAYPSSVLMNAIPAKVAGVEEIIMVTPPTANLNNAVMAAAQIAGVDRVIAVGGSQAVAALTYGAGFIPKVDKLVGPGNAFVAAAKRMAYGKLDIDMVAGPSEVLVIADETANPEYVAADMLSQAEHDAMASSVLVTTSFDLAEKVREALIRQANALSRNEIIFKSLNDYGQLFVCESMEEAADLANEIAPEHLEIMTARPDAVLPMIKNAGAVFMGKNSPEPLGDYMAGPSHVLPTSGTARFFSPLSVDSFLKKMSIINYNEQDLSDIHEDIIRFANAEYLTAHANSIKVRFADDGKE
ncbi:MAG: histidinol dehydrogenase [Ruminococcaceae bacterium]|nr:histidinol dehydrogenase [Oscillospiraceae bacterium]